jgi:hypothetical protein
MSWCLLVSLGTDISRTAPPTSDYAGYKSLLAYPDVVGDANETWSSYDCNPQSSESEEIPNSHY